MSDARPSAMRKIMLAVWGMATLTLAFSVVMLSNELKRRGGNTDVEAVEAAPKPAPAPQRAAASGEAEEVTLYFASLDGQHLVPESRPFLMGDSTAANCRTVLDALIHGPRSQLTPIIPNSAAVRAVYLLDNGELVIDFDHGFQTDAASSASAESLMVYGVVNTLAQPGLAATGDRAVRTVRMLFNGAPAGDRFPAHIDLSNPIAPDPTWIESASAPDYE